MKILPLFSSVQTLKIKMKVFDTININTVCVQAKGKKLDNETP